MFTVEKGHAELSDLRRKHSLAQVYGQVFGNLTNVAHSSRETSDAHDQKPEAENRQSYGTILYPTAILGYFWSIT